MTVKEIRVTAGRTFNHPHEQYSNLRPEVMMVADLAPGEDAAEATRLLQHQAEGLVEDHKRNLLKSIDELYQLTLKQAEARGLKRELENVSKRLEELRKEHPDLDFAQIGNGDDEQKEVF